MTRIVTLLFAALLWTGIGPALAQACTPKLDHPPLVRKGWLLAVINPTVPPIQYVDDNGNIVGLDVDLGNAIAKRLCLNMQFQSTMFATMIPLLKESRIDMIDTFMWYSPQRAAQVMMIPYGASTLAIVVQKGDKDKIEGLDYFSGKRFGAELGTVDAEDVVKASTALQKAGKRPIDLHTFPNYAAVLQAMLAGQMDGAFINTEQAYWYQKKRNQFRIAVTGYDPHAEALAFKQPAVAHAVAEALDEMYADGSLQKIFTPYGHCLLPAPYKVTIGPLPAPKCRQTVP